MTWIFYLDWIAGHWAPIVTVLGLFSGLRFYSKLISNSENGMKHLLAMNRPLKLKCKYHRTFFAQNLFWLVVELPRPFEGVCLAQDFPSGSGQDLRKVSLDK